MSTPQMNGKHALHLLPNLTNALHDSCYITWHSMLVGTKSVKVACHAYDGQIRKGVPLKQLTGSLDIALGTAAKLNNGTGVGHVFHGIGPILVDLDRYKAAADSVANVLIDQALQHMPTFIEYGPRGEGSYHLWGNIDDATRARISAGRITEIFGCIDILADNCFATLTGKAYRDAPVADISKLVNHILDIAPPTAKAAPVVIGDDDRALLDKYNAEMKPDLRDFALLGAIAKARGNRFLERMGTGIPYVARDAANPNPKRWYKEFASLLEDFVAVGATPENAYRAFRSSAFVTQSYPPNSDGGDRVEKLKRMLETKWDVTVVSWMRKQASRMPAVQDGVFPRKIEGEAARPAPVAPWYEWPDNEIAQQARDAKDRDALFVLISTLRYDARMIEHVAPILARAIELGIGFGTPAHTQLLQDLHRRGIAGKRELTNAFNDTLAKFKQHARASSSQVALITNTYGEVLAHARNAEIMIMSDSAMEGVLVFDEFYEDILIAKCPPWLMLEDGEQWVPRVPVDYDLLKLMTRLHDHRLNVTIQTTIQAAKLVAGYTTQNCAKVDIEAEVWDGVPRLNTMMAVYFGCEDSQYNRFIGAKSLIGAVARVYRPGCQMDTVLLLYSADQGRNKTTAIRALFGPDSYGVLTGDYRSKDELQKTRGKRVVDFSEMEIFSRREMKGANSFITEAEDEYREPYGYKNKVYKRKYVFWGTTNTKQMLSDETGARRYFVGDVTGRCDVAALLRDRGQLWAEAKARFDAGERWHADPVEDAWFEEYAKEIAATHTEVGAWDTTIAAYLAYVGHYDGQRDRWIATGARPAPREFVTPLMVLRDALGFEDARIQPKDNTAAGRVLRKFGYESGPKRFGKGAKDVAWGWVLRGVTKSFEQQISTVAQLYGIEQTPLIADVDYIEFIRNEASKAAEDAKNG